MQSHLTEAGSASTGSLIIWDTGEYSILPYYENESTETEHSNSDTDQSQQGDKNIPESEKLRMAFQQVPFLRKIKATSVSSFSVLTVDGSEKSAYGYTELGSPQITPSHCDLAVQTTNQHSPDHQLESAEGNNPPVLRHLEHLTRISFQGLELALRLPLRPPRRPVPTPLEILEVATLIMRRTRRFDELTLIPAL